MKSKVHPKYKTTYRVGNWREYERALVQRGDVTLWLSAAATDAWRPSPSGRPGGQKRFSDVAIETALILRLVFGLPLRQTEGFVRRRWKKETGYHRQAHVENVFFRYKSIIGEGFRARSSAGQGAEAVLACNVLNRMRDLGRPASYAIRR